MAKKILLFLVKLLMDIGIIIATFFVIFFIYYFFNGSFELYPTSEQDEKARIAAILFFYISYVIDSAFIVTRFLIQFTIRTRSK